MSPRLKAPLADRILEALRREGSADSATLAAGLGARRASVTQVLLELLAKNQVKRVITQPGGYFALSDSAVNTRLHQERVRRALALLTACEAIERSDGFEISPSTTAAGEFCATAEVGDRECGTTMASLVGALIELGAQVLSP